VLSAGQASAAARMAIGRRCMSNSLRGCGGPETQRSYITHRDRRCATGTSRFGHSPGLKKRCDFHRTVFPGSERVRWYAHANVEIAMPMAKHAVVVLQALDRSDSAQPFVQVPVPPKTGKVHEIESVLGSELPVSARKYAAWWETATPEQGVHVAPQVWRLPPH